MTFELKPKPILAIYSPSVHRLETTAVKQWWQVADAFKLIPRRTQDPFRNDALRSAASFLATLPFGVALMLYQAVPYAITHHQELKVLQLVAMVGVVWLIQAYMLVRSGRNHVRIVHEVTATEEGLEVRSPFFRRNIRWHEVSDLFQVGNTDQGYGMYELDCNNGETVLLSSQLSNSYRLFELIENKLARTPRPSFQHNHRISDGFFDMIPMTVSAIYIALIFSLVKATALPTLPEVAMMIGLLSAISGLGWFYKNKIPQLVRYGDSEIYVRTRTQTRLINWDQVRQIKRFAGITILKTRSNWFAIFVSKTEPLYEKLQCRAKRIAANRHQAIS